MAGSGAACRAPGSTGVADDAREEGSDPIVAIYVNPRPLPGRRKREIMALGGTGSVGPLDPLPPPPSPTPEFDGIDPLLQHFLSLDQQALRTIPGMTTDRVKLVMEARQGCRVWADLEARLKHDPDLMNAI